MGILRHAGRDRVVSVSGSTGLFHAPLGHVLTNHLNFADVGDTTTLSNPEIVDDIRHHVRSEKHARGEVPRELTAEEEAEIKAFGHTE